MAGDHGLRAGLSIGNARSSLDNDTDRELAMLGSAQPYLVSDVLLGGFRQRLQLRFRVEVGNTVQVPAARLGI